MATRLPDQYERDFIARKPALGAEDFVFDALIGSCCYYNVNVVLTADRQRDILLQDGKLFAYIRNSSGQVIATVKNNEMNVDDNEYEIVKTESRSLLKRITQDRFIADLDVSAKHYGAKICFNVLTFTKTDHRRLLFHPNRTVIGANDHAIPMSDFSVSGTGLTDAGGVFFSQHDNVVLRRVAFIDLRDAISLKPER